MMVIKSLEAGYGGRPVLAGVDLTIPPGERLSLVGHNGAGKSTLLKAITGVLRPSQGSIVFDGERIEGMTPEALVRRGIVQVPAGRRVFPRMSVEQNLLAGAFVRLKRTAVRADLDDLVERLPVLKKKLRTPAGLLSGGEQQMLAIARGLMARPRFLMVDEPSLGLSPVMVGVVFQMLAGLAAATVTLVLAEQNVRKALAITDRTVVMAQGKVVTERASRDLLADDAFRKAYLGLTAA